MARVLREKDAAQLELSVLLETSQSTREQDLVDRKRRREEEEQQRRRRRQEDDDERSWHRAEIGEAEARLHKIQLQEATTAGKLQARTHPLCC